MTSFESFLRGLVLAVLLGGAAVGQTTIPVSPPKVIRVSGGVMAGQILSKVEPVYPAEAKARGIAGAVVLRAVIGTEGTVQNLTVVSGNELLAAAALDAVRQWTYKPYLLNGEPIAVETTVTVNFSLGSDSASGGLNPPTARGSGSPCAVPDEGPAGADGGATRIPAAFMSTMVLNHPSPAYPKEAKKKRIQGVVVVHAVIGTDGAIERAVALCGPAELQESAVAAVKQWTYKPYYLETGKPTKVETTITLTYAFGPAAVPPAGKNSWVGGLEVVEIPSDAPELAGAKKEQPKYPKDAKKGKVSGEVEVAVLIGADGKVESAQALSGPEMLQSAAVEAVKRYRYPKYSVAGVPKMVRTVETVSFTLS